MRQSNFELLRIVLMFLIVFWHSLQHWGGNDQTSLLMADIPLYLLLMAFSVVGVNCYLLISGYFGMKFKVKTLISFIVQALFYSLTIYFALKLTTGDKYLENDSLFKSLMPIMREKWWFLSAYLSLYIISPFLNKGVEYLSKFQLGTTIVILLFFEVAYPLIAHNTFGADGSTLAAFILIYLIARYLKIYNIEVPKPFLFYLLNGLVLFFVSSLLISSNHATSGFRLYRYSSVFVIVGAILFLYIFKNLTIRPSKTLNSIASLTFGVYLIHDHPGIRILLRDLLHPIIVLQDNMFALLLVLLGISFLVLVICLLIEKIRVLICTPIVNLIYRGIASIMPGITSI